MFAKVLLKEKNLHLTILAKFLKSKSDENDFNGLNPKTDKRVYKTRKKTTLNGRKTRRADRIYGVGSSEMPLHGKLSQETRDDEKEWF